jgi:hypothetical protein
MKGITELALVAVLLLMVYDKPTILTEFANSVLGKFILVLFVVMIAKARGLTAGVIAALIMIMLMHESLEGFGVREGHGGHSTLPTKFNRQGPTCNPIKKNGSQISCKKDTDCGTCKSVCTGAGQCKAIIDPEFQSIEAEMAGGAGNDVGTFDIRLHEGMNNMNACANTIAAMKFQNGFTGNREQYKGFV